MKPSAINHARRENQPWWHEFFDDDYAAYGLSRDEPEFLQRTIDFIARTLGLQAGQLVFDQCCGIGRVALPLAERGIKVIGVDQAASYVTAAQKAADSRRLPCRFHHGDAYEYIAPEPCDAAINWFTSWGYSPDDDTNRLMFQRAFDSLMPGGRFVMDFMSIPGVMANYKGNIIDRPTSPALHGLIVLHETKPNFLTGMMHSDWKFLYPDGRRVSRSIETRMYLPHQIASMLNASGFTDVELFGSVDGAAFERTSPRCIVAARKPASSQ